MNGILLWFAHEGRLVFCHGGCHEKTIFGDVDRRRASGTSVDGVCREGCGAETGSVADFVVGRKRYRLHGGATLVAGPTHPRYKHGRYSKALPVSLREDYETARNDPELAELRDELALLTVIICERLGRLDKGDEVSDEIADLLEKKSRIAAREWKRIVDMQQVLTIESAMTLMDNLALVVLKHVDNPETVRAIAVEFQRISGPDAKPEARV